MKVIHNLLNSIVSFDDGRVRLQPRGTPGDQASITDTQAALPQIIAATVNNRVRVMSVAESEPAKKTTPLPPVQKPTETTLPTPKVTMTAREMDATPVESTPAKIATAIEAVVEDSGADTNDEQATDMTEKDSTERKHKKSRRR